MANRIETPTSQKIERARRSPRNPASAGAPVVILRESGLDTDLATAIAEIRAKEGADCRILVVAPDVPEDAQINDPLPFQMSAAQEARRLEIDALDRAGSRLLPLLGCLDLFLNESEAGLTELDEAVTDRPRATLQSHVRTLRDIVDWTKTVATDLHLEARAVANGFRVLDLGDLLQEATVAVEQEHPDIRINVSPNARTLRTLGRSADLAEAMYLGLSLVAERLGRTGGILVEGDVGHDLLRIRISGIGTPCTIDLDPMIARFRRLIVDQHGGKIMPGLFGTTGAGVVIQLPVVTG